MQALYRLLLVLLFCGCTPEAASSKTASSDTFFPISINGVTLQLQLALNQSEWSKGLMNREKLMEDHGMLFLFKAPERRSFWMRNTGIPLDLAYFDAHGRLLEIHSLYPYDENSVYSHSKEVLIAVEMNQGWFSRKAIQPGAKLDMEALRQAVVSRGYSSSDYSLEANEP